MEGRIFPYVVIETMPQTEKDPTGIENHGNFRALLDFRVDAGDSLLSEHLTTVSMNSTYTSLIIQNQIIDILAD